MIYVFKNKIDRNNASSLTTIVFIALLALSAMLSGCAPKGAYHPPGEGPVEVEEENAKNLEVLDVASLSNIYLRTLLAGAVEIDVTVNGSPQTLKKDLSSKKLSLLTLGLNIFGTLGFDAPMGSVSEMRILLSPKSGSQLVVDTGGKQACEAVLGPNSKGVAGLVIKFPTELSPTVTSQIYGIDFAKSQPVQKDPAGGSGCTIVTDYTAVKH